MKAIAGLVVALGAIAAGALTASAGTSPPAANEAAARHRRGRASRAPDASGRGEQLRDRAERRRPRTRARERAVRRRRMWSTTTVGGSSPGARRRCSRSSGDTRPRAPSSSKRGRATAARDSSSTATSWPARVHVLSSRQLVVEVVWLGGGSTALRADALVVWMTPRRASERVPRAIDRLQVTVVNGKRTTQGPLTFTLSRQLNRVRSVIDALPAAQPGVAACPADFDDPGAAGVLLARTRHGRRRWRSSIRTDARASS